MNNTPSPLLSPCRTSIRHWLGRWTYTLLPGLCLRCGLASDRALDLCTGCENDFALVDHHCRQCSVPLPVAGLCGDCLQDPPGFARILAAYRYQRPLSDLVLAAKNHRDLAALQVLGHLLAGQLQARCGGQSLPDMLVPVPLHWRRRLGRGYNQALELARPVARELAIPLVPGLVSRTRYLAQQGLHRNERRRQLRDAFRVAGDVSGCRIAIVDDVVTTTGTVRALSQALMTAGAGAVEVWCLARTPLEK